MASVLSRASQIDDLLDRIRTVAFVGIKPRSHATEPAHYVPAICQSMGLGIVPVPVRYPDEREILGEPAYPTLDAVPASVDLVCLFRRPPDVPAHVPEIVRKRPIAAWMQLGILHDGAAASLVEAGIDVVMNRCLSVELARRVATRR